MSKDVINTEELQSNLIKGLLKTLESLYNQATFNSNRLENLQNVVGRLENQIFSEEAMRELPADRYLEYYDMALKSMQMTVRFLENIHKMSLETSSVVKVAEQFSEFLSLLEGEEEGDTIDLKKLKFVKDKLKTMLKAKNE